MSKLRLRRRWSSKYRSRRGLWCRLPQHLRCVSKRVCKGPTFKRVWRPQSGVVLQPKPVVQSCVQLLMPAVPQQQHVVQRPMRVVQKKPQRGLPL